MRIAAFALLFAVAALATGCPQSTYFDAGADAQPVQAQTVDISPSNADAAPPVCPGGLFVAASEGQAACTHANEICEATDQSSNTVECTCSATDAGPALWECHQPH
jgi:hypothetical protein